MVGKIVGQMYFCTICPKEYKTNNGLKKHYVTEHTVVGARYQDKPVVVLAEVVEESGTLGASIMAKDARQEMEDILTSVVETVTTDMDAIFSQNDEEVEVEAVKEVEVEAVEEVSESVEPIEGQTESISQISQNMRDMVEIIDNPSQMYGSCDKCDYISQNDTDLKEHHNKSHTEITTITNEGETIKKMGTMLRKASVEKKAFRKQITDLKKVLEAAQKENSVKTKRISLLMVENSTKDDLSNVETTEKETDDTADKTSEKETIFDCALCEFKAKTRGEVDGHIRFEHLKCLTCNEHFRTVEEFKSHMTKSHKNSIWHKKKNCDLCKRCFSNWTLYEGHIKKHQCLKFTCTFCNAEFVTKATGVEHIKNCSKRPEESFTCHKCEFKAPTENEMSKHFDEVHLEGFETITNMENSTNEDVTIQCIYDCDFKGKTEEEVAKHIDDIHLQIETKDQAEHKSVETKVDRSNKVCKNGETCRFLKQNRCLFFHKEAAQPEEGQWEEVRPRRQGRQSGLSGETWVRGVHGVSYRVHPVTVKWCKDGDKCHKGYRMSNGKRWNCVFRHEPLDFNQRSSMRRK